MPAVSRIPAWVADFETFLEQPKQGVLLCFQDRKQPEVAGHWFGPLQDEIVCSELADVSRFFKNIEKVLAQGNTLAGYFTYEFGHAFEHTGLRQPPSGKKPYAWLGVFKKPICISTTLWHNLSQKNQSREKQWPSYWLRPLVPVEAYSNYRKTIKKIQAYITRGETYQINYTFPLNTRVDGAAGHLFMEALRLQPVRYAGFIRGGGRSVLSFSPELFFRTYQGKISVQPMKGTAERGMTSALDRTQRKALQQSEKNRAENVMIVDLLRNDLGRCCKSGSVQVDRLFQVETYRTLFQMTSAIRGELHPKCDWQQLFGSLFPCGSVTGAPKIKSMQLIREMENVPRQVYTGAIGFLSPRKKSCFNVAIRTLELDDSNHHGVLSVGSGIVADSQAKAEWQECFAKARFLEQMTREFEILETLRFQSGRGYIKWEKHCARMGKSAAYFGICFSSTQMVQSLRRMQRTFRPLTDYRVRCLLSANGFLRVEAQVWTPIVPRNVPRVKICKRSVSSRNLFLYHKTTNREFYNRAYRQAIANDLGEVLFCNERGELTEGAITNLFIRKGRIWLTPPIASGLLPGIERADLLANSAIQVKEQIIFPRDLFNADEIRLANSVRGWFEASVVR